MQKDKNYCICKHHKFLFSRINKSIRFPTATSFETKMTIYVMTLLTHSINDCVHSDHPSTTDAPLVWWGGLVCVARWGPAGALAGGTPLNPPLEHWPGIQDDLRPAVDLCWEKSDKWNKCFSPSVEWFRYEVRTRKRFSFGVLR